MSAILCQHVQKYKIDHGLTTYRIIQAYFVACVSISARKRKAAETFCHHCNSRGNRLHACLTCVYFGCFDYGHIQKHALTSNHDISVDIKNGNVFCHKCSDYTYDEDFENIAYQYKQQAGPAKGSELYIPWEPKQYEIQILKENNGLKKISEDSCIGLRGLLNLGNTCFVNCIVQVLVHTPLLRDYFLSDKHICHLQDTPESCLACEMFNIFQEFYSGQSAPHIPYKLVYLIWKHAEYLIGFDQQDAHEFLIAILNGLHAHCHKKEGDEKLYHTVNYCNCIIHQVFTGSYQSDVVCSQCNRVSTRIETFWDIGLDLGETTGNKNGIDANPESLVDCLRRYTHPEILHNTQCTDCLTYDATLKQLTIKKLPVVACFHLKRLAANSGQKVCNKNTTHVMFPEFLDMSPFMSTTRNEKTDLPDGAHSVDLQNSENMLTLFAVVSHRGDQAGGHYTSYIRQHRDRWYLCDDDAIMKSSLSDVLESEGYLLFYHKQVLEYEAIQLKNNDC